jgi:hypothetical protein
MALSWGEENIGERKTNGIFGTHFADGAKWTCCNLDVRNKGIWTDKKFSYFQFEQNSDWLNVQCKAEQVFGTGYHKL